MFCIAYHARVTVASQFRASSRGAVRARITISLLALSTIVGCGDGLATVSGQVTLNGEPIQGGPRMSGTVNFYPEDGSGAPAVGFINGTGRYELKTGARDGIRPGTYLIGISVNKITMPANPNDMPIPTLITPKKYASVTESGIRKEVEPGVNTFDFALRSE